MWDGIAPRTAGIPIIQAFADDKPDTTFGTMNADVLAEKLPGVGANRIGQDVDGADLSRVSGRLAG